MSRDTIKMIAAIVVVGLALVATFLYGNHQSQEQIRKQQQLEQQAKDQNAKQQAATPPAQLAPTPTAPSPAATGPQPTRIPQTGADTWSLVGLASMVMSGQLYLVSRRRRALQHG